MATKKKAVKKKATKKKAVKKKATKKKVSKVPTSESEGCLIRHGGFYQFRQNNSYGKFVYDDKAGISVNVIVEADNAEDANRRAENIGLYFDGDEDCPCCGSRWCSQYSYGGGKDEGTTTPQVYGDTVKVNDPFPHDPKDELGFIKWLADDEYEGFIHYKNGTMVGFWKRA